METTTFIPKLPNKSDQLGVLLRRISQICLLVGIVSLPLFFIPNPAGTALFPKVFLLLVCALAAGFFYSLSILRTGTLTLRFSPVILSFLVLIAIGVVSASLTSGTRLSLFGDALEIHTVGFLALLGFVMSLSAIILNSKKLVLITLASFVGSLCIAALILVAKIFIGPTVLSFGILNAVTDNLIGSFNDLGIFAGLIVIALLVALVQLELPKKGLWIMGGVMSLALFVLVSVNFFFLWVILGGFSLLVLMYVLTKDRFGVASDVAHHHDALLLPKIVLVGVVCLVSGLFLVGGTYFGTVWSNMTGINYVEIRPSFSATFDIVRQTYTDNALLGFGPNRFTEAWALYKDASINDTIFWNTSFAAGAGYIPTWFVTTGVLGAVAWILFLGLFLYSGVRMLLQTNINDTFWFFVGTVSFVAGCYIWVLSFMYVPGPTIILLGAIATGMMVAASYKLQSGVQKNLNLLSNSRTGFILIGAVMVFIIGTFAVGYGAVQQFSAAYTYANAGAGIEAGDATAVTIVSNRILDAYNTYPSDLYARTLANYQFSSVANLLSLTEPTAEQQQQFQSAIAAALSVGAGAVAQKPTDARNWQMLGDIYANLTLLGIEGAKERAFESYQKAEALDPTNPYYVLQKASIEARAGNPDEARRLALLSLQLKRNYTDALYFLTQLDIQKGDIASAIATTQAMITLEPNNPGRYYQLGVLYGATNETDAAIAAFDAAIIRNPSYANARYFRAQQYLIKGDAAKAITELETVRGLNPDNTVVDSLITSIKDGSISTQSLTASTTPIAEGNQVQTENEVTTATEVPDSDLLTPVNTAPTGADSNNTTPPSDKPQP